MVNLSTLNPKPKTLNPKPQTGNALQEEPKDPTVPEAAPTPYALAPGFGYLGLGFIGL